MDPSLPPILPPSPPADEAILAQLTASTGWQRAVLQLTSTRLKLQIQKPGGVISQETITLQGLRATQVRKLVRLPQLAFGLLFFAFASLRFLFDTIDWTNVVIGLVGGAFMALDAWQVELLFRSGNASLKARVRVLSAARARRFAKEVEARAEAKRQASSGVGRFTRYEGGAPR